MWIRHLCTLAIGVSWMSGLWLPGLGAQQADTGRVEATVRLDLEAESLHVRMTYGYYPIDEREDAAKFYLNRAMDVRTVGCSRCQAFSFNREAEPLPTLTIQLREPLVKGRMESFTFEYSGSLAEIYKPAEEFLELGLDDFWFPIHPTFNGIQFRYTLSLEIAQPGFTVVGNGRAREQQGRWLLESLVPDFDIDVVVARGLRTHAHRESGVDLQVISKNLPDSVPAMLLRDMVRHLEYYNATFGRSAPQTTVTGVIRPYTPIAGKGGYFRRGYFILDNTPDASRYFLPVAHELAHAWWRIAGSRDAWLNESFAEYSAMLSLRRQRGVAAFDSVLALKARNSAGLPPIYGFDRTQNRQLSPRVLYVKGPVVLHHLERQLGEERFLEFLHAVVEAGVRETDDLLDLLGRFAGPAVATEWRRVLEK